MHVVHQLVLWLFRVTGERISEPFGLRVANVIIDDDGHGFLLVSAQGGRAFRERDEDGRFQVVHHRDMGKSDSAFRRIALPVR